MITTITGMLSGDLTLMPMLISGLLKIRVKDVNILGSLRLHTCITPFLASLPQFRTPLVM